MARERFCRVCGGWHDLNEPWPFNCIPEAVHARSDLPSPMLIADSMTPVQSMLDGQMYDSKSALRRTYKQAGMVEVGNDPSITNPKPRQKPKADRAAVKAAVRKAASQAGLGA